MGAGLRSALQRRRPALEQDTELDVLWLRGGSQELALSAEGLWVRSGRATADLPWGEVDQVQLAAPPGASRKRGRVEVFTHGDTVYVVGPFPSDLAARWLTRCRETVTATGRRPLPLDGSDGFAVR